MKRKPINLSLLIGVIFTLFLSSCGNVGLNDLVKKKFYFHDRGGEYWYTFLENNNVSYSMYKNGSDTILYYGNYCLNKNEVIVTLIDTNFCYITKQSPFITINKNKKKKTDSINVKIKVWCLDNNDFKLNNFSELKITNSNGLLISHYQVEDSLTFKYPLSYSTLHFDVNAVNKDVIDFDIIPMNDLEVNVYFDLKWINDKNKFLPTYNFKYKKRILKRISDGVHFKENS